MGRIKQAVLLIHGIGEQRPMDTLRGFVEEVWDKDTSVHNSYIENYQGKGIRWSKPDNISGGYELRCLTTASNKNRVLTDFYEFYWAHLMEGNKISHVLAWLKRILLKGPRKLPKPLVGIWFVVVITLLGIAYLLLNQTLPEVAQLSWKNTWIPILAGLILIPFLLSVFENIVGDAARYLDPSPKNIKRRQEIRAKGINVLKKLHASGKYQRIIVVGHSLGTFIAYDILSFAWQDYRHKITGSPDLPALDQMNALLAAWDKYLKASTRELSTEERRQAGEKLWPFIKKEGEQLDQSHANNRELDTYLKDKFTEEYHRLQPIVFQEQKDQNGISWLVSDLITLGSPLTYSDLLLAKDKTELVLKQRERELPTSPPQLTDESKINYGKNSSKLHHAAVFGVTRWTNIYFPPAYTIFGDIISGPLQSLFGYGIKDIPVKTKISSGLFSHTLYWTPDKDRLATDEKAMAAAKKRALERPQKKEEKEETAVDKKAREEAEKTDHIVQLRKAVNLLNK